MATKEQKEKKTNNDKLQNSYALVQKSNPLQSLAKTSLSLSELKILDVYLSRIDMHDPENRTVILSKGEIENLLGISQLRPEDLKSRLKHLNQMVEVEDKNKANGFELISLFEKLSGDYDKDGHWKVALTCTSSAREYIFNIESIGYLRYRLQSVIGLNSRYSYVLYLYLERNAYRGTWEIGLDELRDMLSCKDDCYAEFKDFNNKVLKKCYDDINSQTDCKYSYKTLRSGRKVDRISFTVDESFNEKLLEVQKIDKNTDNYVVITEPNRSEMTEYEQLLYDKLGLSVAEISNVKAHLRQIPNEMVPPDELDAPGTREFAFVRYLSEKITVINRINEEKKIKSKCLYLIKMIDNEVKKFKEEN